MIDLLAVVETESTWSIIEAITKGGVVALLVAFIWMMWRGDLRWKHDLEDMRARMTAEVEGERRATQEQRQQKEYFQRRAETSEANVLRLLSASNKLVENADRNVRAATETVEAVQKIVQHGEARL